MRSPPVRLTVSALARLLAVADRHGLGLKCLALARRSPRGKALLDQLDRLRREVGRGTSWAYLAELLAEVDRRAGVASPQKEEGKALRLVHVRAAAQLRGSTGGEPGRAAYVALAEHLAEQLAELADRGSS